MATSSPHTDGPHVVQNHSICSQVDHDSFFTVLTPIAINQGTVEAQKSHIYTREIVRKLGLHQNHCAVRLVCPSLQNEDTDEALSASPQSQLFVDPTNTSYGQNRCSPSPLLRDAQDLPTHPLDETRVHSSPLSLPMQVPAIVTYSPEWCRRQQQSTDKPQSHKQDKVKHQAEVTRRDSGYTLITSVNRQSRRDTASLDVSANMTELHYTYALDINTLVISLDRYRQALIYDTVRTLTRASSETEEEEVKEEKIEEKRVAGEKSDEDHEDEDEDDSEESILPWVICKTLRSDFNILSFAADYKNAARARAASRVAAKAAVIAQAELGLLRTNNLRRRYGGSLVEVCSHAVKGSSTSCAILDEGSTNDCYMSYIDYPDNLGEDEDGHECVQCLNWRCYGCSHLHTCDSCSHKSRLMSEEQWKANERHVRTKMYRLMSWSINWAMDVLMMLLLWIQGLHVNIDAAANVDVGYTGVLGEIVTKDNSKEDSTERAVQAVESWQSQTRTLPLLGVLQKDGQETRRRKRYLR